MNFLLKIVNNFLYKLFYYFIVFYQKAISPILPARCRYYPTCSNYGKQALTWHGLWTGSWLLLKRISSCNPLGGQYISPTTPVHGKSQSWYVYKDTKSYVARLNYLMKSI